MAAVSLPPILSDHMVLQRSAHTAVWGKADAGETVTVSLGDVHGQAVADASGHWKAELDLSSTKEGPFDMVVAGSNKIVVADVLVGEVWLCSGQSNMAYTLNRALGGTEEIAQATNARLRQFRVDLRAAKNPQDECKGAWVVASPTTTAGFSAVAYFFAKDLEAKINAPVGIILSAWAGTVATAWTSADALAADSELKAIADRGHQEEINYPAQKAAFVPAMQAWESANGRQDHAFDATAFTGAQITEAEWKSVTLPGNFHEQGLPDSGAVWLRRKITMPTGGVAISIDPGGPHDFNTIYWNGHKIGGMDETNAGGKVDTRRYIAPAELVTAGDNILALRLFTPTEKGGISTAPFMDVGPKRTLLADGWQAYAEFDLPALTDAARQSLPQVPWAPDAHNQPSCLFNGMISPLTAETLAGVVWYQGEQDTGRPRALYRKMLETLVKDWRAHWATDLPFVLCQLPNNGVKADAPGESRWAEIRQAQLDALELPRTASPVLVDLGEKDVHPPDKKPVGERIALAALGAFYSQKVVSSGPVLQSMKVDGNKLILSFTSADGLVAKSLPADYQPTYLSPERKPLTRHSSGDLEGFALCGADKKWSWAEAKIEGQTVIVSSTSVEKPTSVRYGWADNPTCNLYNNSGLPASPFEADVP